MTHDAWLVDTLPHAIEGTRVRWPNQRSVPLRLHEAKTTEGELGAPRFSNTFAAALDASPNTVISSSRTVDCHHPLLPQGRPAHDCPECIGTRVKEVRSDVFAFPMSRALARLRNGLASRRQPHPYGLVIVLASHDWSAQVAARVLGIPWERAEPLFLMALRRLHGHYAEGPVVTRTSAPAVVGWLTMSDSQRAAIEAGETAA